MARRSRYAEYPPTPRADPFMDGSYGPHVISYVRHLCEKVRDNFGRPMAVRLIVRYGRADQLVNVPAVNYQTLTEVCIAFLKGKSKTQNEEANVLIAALEERWTAPYGDIEDFFDTFERFIVLLNEQNIRPGGIVERKYRETRIELRDRFALLLKKEV